MSNLRSTRFFDPKGWAGITGLSLILASPASAQEAAIGFDFDTTVEGWIFQNQNNSNTSITGPLIHSTDPASNILPFGQPPANQYQCPNPNTFATNDIPAPQTALAMPGL